jgi:beta-N-acetylhexosaminidase
MPILSMIVGCSGFVLTAQELEFYRDANPWGFILFKRNIDNPEQVKALTAQMRACVGRNDAPVLIDQEGGRVQRMGPPYWPKYPSGRELGAIYAQDPVKGRELCRQNSLKMAHDLLQLGINVDCLPVLDVPVKGAHDVIGDRAYSYNAETVAILGRAAAEGLLAGGVMPVIKHIPGHGRAGADSHHNLPIVTASRNALMKQDFVPFQALADMPAAMSAHVVFTSIDKDAPATTSRKVIRTIIRGKIGFDGLLMSDDLSMKALIGTFKERTEACFAAGIDIGLHCNGNMEEMRAVAEGAPILAGKAKRRAEAALARIKHRVEPIFG